MELNKKILKIGLSIILITFIFTISLVHIYKIKNPVFLEMFVEKPMNFYENCASVEGLELKYITNIWDDRKISSIKFKDQPNIEALVLNNEMDYSNSSFSNYNNGNRETHGIYTINTIYINIGLKNLHKESNEIELNNAILTFNDGSRLDVNLGQIILFNYKNDKNSGISHIGGNEQITETSTKGYCDIGIEKNIKLLKLDSPLLHNLKGYFSASIGKNDYKNISKISYKKDTKSVINLKIETSKSILKRYSFYDISPKLYYEDEEGRKSYIRIENIHLYPYKFNLKDIFNYLKLRGEI